MSDKDTGSVACGIMAAFATRTGLTSGGPQRRYLWTDAFAVCNFLGLYTASGDERYRQLALGLIDQVHHVLGRHRPDDARRGWLSGLEGEDAEQHPTAGGLRIGKSLPERRPEEQPDQPLEWDRDGQYFHYLTRWMHALDRASRVTRDPRYNRWALEMAKRVHAAFVYRPAVGPPRMYWKMSIDLSRPLVPSMGHHDPLDAYLTYAELEASSPGTAGWPDLRVEIAEAGQMVAGREWATADPLGIGGLLSDAYRAAQLIAAGHLRHPGLVSSLLEAALVGLRGFARDRSLQLPASHRLAFRELGLAIGLHTADRLRSLVDAESGHIGDDRRLQERLQALIASAPLAEEIECFWLEPAHQRATTWLEHLDINSVMLATSLAPDSYLSP